MTKLYLFSPLSTEHGAVVSWKRDVHITVVESRGVAHLHTQLICTSWLCLCLSCRYYNLSVGCCWVCWKLLLGRSVSSFFLSGILVSSADGMALLWNPRGLRFDSPARTYYNLHMMPFLSTGTSSTIGFPRSMAQAFRLLAHQSGLSQSPFLLWAPFKAGSLSLQPWDGLAHHAQGWRMLPSAPPGAY